MWQGALDSLWHPHSSSQHILCTIHFKLSDLFLEWSSSLFSEWSSSLSLIMTFFISCPLVSQCTPALSSKSPCVPKGRRAKGVMQKVFLDHSHFIGINLVAIALITESFVCLNGHDSISEMTHKWKEQRQKVNVIAQNDKMHRPSDNDMECQWMMQFETICSCLNSENTKSSDAVSVAFCVASCNVVCCR